MRETWVQSLGWEDPLEKGKATQSSILASRILSIVQSMGSQRVGHNQSHHFITNKWENNGNSDRLIFRGSKITADGDRNHEIKRHFILGRKSMTNLDSILKCRDITLPTKVHLVNTIVFTLVMDGCECWTIKKVECQRTDAFEVWHWRRLLRVPGLQRDQTCTS